MVARLLSATSAAATFSRARLRLRVPGMGAMSSPWASGPAGPRGSERDVAAVEDDQRGDDRWQCERRGDPDRAEDEGSAGGCLEQVVPGRELVGQQVGMRCPEMLTSGLKPQAMIPETTETTKNSSSASAR